MPVRRDIQVLGRTIGTTNSLAGDLGGRLIEVRLNDVGEAVFGERAQPMLDIDGAALVMNLVTGETCVEVPGDPDLPVGEDIPDCKPLEPNWLLLLLEDAKLKASEAN